MPPAEGRSMTGVTDLPELQQDFFRTRLWGARHDDTGSGQKVPSQAADLLGPSSSRAVLPREDVSPKAVPPAAKTKAPRVSGGGSRPSEEFATPVRRSARLQPATETPSPRTPPRTPLSTKVVKEATASPPKRKLLEPPASPARTRLRAKSPSPSPVPVRESNVVVRLVSSPARSPKTVKDGNMLKRTSAVRQLPLKSLVLTQVPIETMSSSLVSAEVGSASRWPKRCRVRPLEHWRNERFIYERKKGSKAPSIVAAELNLGPRPEEAFPRPVSCLTLQVPPALQRPRETMAAGVEFVGLQSQHLSSKVYTLPVRAMGVTPYTVALEGPGVILIFEGSLRLAFEGSNQEVVLQKGDTAVVREEQTALAAPSFHSGTTTCAVGARFQWVKVLQSK
jgi:hypothetical protein